MKLKLCAAVLLLAALALPVQAQEMDYRLPKDVVGITGQKDGSQWNRLTAMTYIPQLGAWCARLDSGHEVYGGCVLEYQIPPAQLRALRAAAGLPLEAPVWNGTKGEFVALPPVQ